MAFPPETLKETKNISFSPKQVDEHPLHCDMEFPHTGEGGRGGGGEEFPGKSETS